MKVTKITNCAIVAQGTSHSIYHKSEAKFAKNKFFKNEAKFAKNKFVIYRILSMVYAFPELMSNVTVKFRRRNDDVLKMCEAKTT